MDLDWLVRAAVCRQTPSSKVIYIYIYIHEVGTGVGGVNQAVRADGLPETRGSDRNRF